MKWIVYDKIGELHLRVGKKGGNSGQAKRWVIKKNIDTKPAHGRKIDQKVSPYVEFGAIIFRTVYHL